MKRRFPPAIVATLIIACSAPLLHADSFDDMMAAQEIGKSIGRDISTRQANFTQSGSETPLQNLSLDEIRVATVDLDQLLGTNQKTRMAKARLEAVAAIDADAKQRREMIAKLASEERTHAQRELDDYMITRQRQINEQAIRMKVAILEEIKPKIAAIAQREGIALVLDSNWRSSESVLVAPENVEWIDLTAKLK